MNGSTRWALALVCALAIDSFQLQKIINYSHWVIFSFSSNNISTTPNLLPGRLRQLVRDPSLLVSLGEKRQDRVEERLSLHKPL